MGLQTEPANLAALKAEPIGWLALGEGVYLHVGKPYEEEVVITVVGVPQASMSGMNGVWVG